MQKCSICLDEINNVVTTNCRHTYCRECIYRWNTYNNICPICRQPLNLLLNTCGYREGSLIERIGINFIHKYSIKNNLIVTPNNIIKGTTPELSLNEKHVINIITGFNVKDKIIYPITNIWICIVNSNIITIGKKEGLNNYKMINGISIIRNDGVTFPIYPSDREYTNNSHTISYLLEV